MSTWKTPAARLAVGALGGIALVGMWQAGAAITALTLLLDLPPLRRLPWWATASVVVLATCAVRVLWLGWIEGRGL